MRHPFVAERTLMSKKKKTNANDPSEQFANLDELVAAQQELNELRQQYGIEPEHKEGKISHLISSFFQRQDEREKVLVNRKKHLWLTFLLGWAGAHRFRAKQYWLGLFYLATCWTGFSVAMTIIDLVEMIPIPPDENGNILV